jgi:hypothetical protein
VRLLPNYLVETPTFRIWNKWTENCQEFGSVVKGSPNLPGFCACRDLERRGRHGSQVIIRGDKSHREREQKAVDGQGDVEDAIWRYGRSANLYYNHPILNILADDFNVPYVKAAQIPPLMQAEYAVGLFLLCPLGDLLIHALVAVSNWISSAFNDL